MPALALSHIISEQWYLLFQRNSMLFILQNISIRPDRYSVFSDLYSACPGLLMHAWWTSHLRLACMHGGTTTGFFLLCLHKT